MSKVLEISCSADWDRLLDGNSIVEPMHSALGCHLLADFFGCQTLPVTSNVLEQRMLKAAKKIGATIVTSSFHEFSPHGLSGVVVIAESHLAIHTWPENGVACIDLFTCSRDMDPLPGLRLLFESFGALSMKMVQSDRGVPN